MKKYERAIDLVLDGVGIGTLKCPYCGKQMKSSSGFTLHKRACGEVASNINAARRLKPKMEARYQTKECKIVYIKDGLVLLDSGDVAPATKVWTRKEREGPRITVLTPKNEDEWVGAICDRYPDKTPDELCKYVMRLYGLTGFASRKWPLESIQEALDRRFATNA